MTTYWFSANGGAKVSKPARLHGGAPDRHAGYEGRKWVRFAIIESAFLTIYVVNIGFLAF